MAHIEKKFSERDANQTLQSAYNDVDATISTNGFLVGKVGNKVTVTANSATVDTYTFFDNAVQLYQIQLTYTDSTKATLVQAERIS
jgi:hypothetical protein